MHDKLHDYFTSPCSGDHRTYTVIARFGIVEFFTYVLIAVLIL
jgi:hypothetical protein